MGQVSLQVVAVWALLAVATVSAAEPEPVPFGMFEPTSLGQAIVGFHDGQVPELAPGDQFLGHAVKRMGSGPFVVVFATDMAPLRQAALADPTVLYVEDDVPLRSLAIPDDTRYGEQWGPSMMGFEDAWDVTFGSSDVIVSVIDSGIRRTHNDFEDDMILAGYDYADNDGNPNDGCGHGTHVSGTVAATTNNQRGVAGMSQSRIMPMKALDVFGIECQGSTSDVADAIRDSAADGAHVISMSIGGGGSASLSSAVSSAWDDGVVLVAAAGNNNGGSVDYPARYADVIAVSALSSSGNVASYSSQGPQVEVAAPGSGILSTYSNSDNSYADLSGTSMACPHVSGAIALALSHAPTASNELVRETLTATAEDLGVAGHDNAYGHGLARVDLLLDNLIPGLSQPENAVPVAAFSYFADGLDLSLDASASADDDVDPLTYAWDLGDGHVASGAAPAHTYGTPGTYEIVLTVADGNGGISVLRDAITVDVAPFPDLYPEIPELTNSVWANVDLEEGESALFKLLVNEPSSVVLAETDGPSCVLPGIYCLLDVELRARHGAPPTDTEADCVSDDQGSDEDCVIGDPALGWWFLRVTSTEGDDDLDVRAVWNDDGDWAEPANAAPETRFTYLVSGLDVEFDGTGSRDADGDVLSYSWEVDGAPASGGTFTHAFPAVGEYTVTLTTDDGNGGTSTLVGTVTTTEPVDPPVDPPNTPPVAIFSASVTDLAVELDASASYDDDGDALSYAWDFGDGNGASGVTATHTFAGDGTYTITLTVDDGQNQTVATEVVNVSTPVDPDPSVPEIQAGQTAEAYLDTGDEAFWKIYVEAGESYLIVESNGPGCPVVCPMDADLSVRLGERPTATEFDCQDDTENAGGYCFISDPAPGWYFIRVLAEAGDGTVEVEATLP